MQYIGSNIRFIFTKIKELLNSHNTDNSAHSELFKSWKRLRNPNNADIADALAATYKNGIGDVLVEVKDDTTFALEDIKLFFRPASFKLISANESNYEGIYITMDGTQGRYVAKTFADSEIMTPEGPSTISTPSELALYPAASDAVLYTPQTLTEAQQKQARTNVGALDVNIKTTPVDIGVGSGSTVYYVQSGWLRPCPDNADNELILQYRRVFDAIGLQRGEPNSEDILLRAKSAYSLYQKGLASESITVTNDPLNAARVYVTWNIVTRRNKHYIYYAQVSTAYQYDCTYCVEDDALINEGYKRPVYSTSTGVGAQTNVEQFRMSAAPTEDMHIATKQYVDTAKTEAQQLGLTTATPGKTIKVKTVQDGKPTEWEVVDMPSGGVQSDWNQNDETAADYVKNRPFYTGNPVETVLVEESTVTFAAVDGMYMGQLESTFSATVGETYKVSWDGAAYECTCVIFNNTPAIGNLSIMGAGSDTGEPFIMGILNGKAIQIVTQNTSASHTFSISRLATEVVKIDEKYLPDTIATKSEVEATQEVLDGVFSSVATFTFDKQTSGRDTFVFNAFNYYKISDFNPAPENVISFKGTTEDGGKSSIIMTGSNCVGYGFFIVVAAAGRCSLPVTETVTYSFDAPSAGLYACYNEGNTAMTAGTGEFTLRASTGSLYITGLLLKSSTADSTKKFRITVDDSGVPTITDESDSTNTWKPTNLPTVTSSDSGKFLRVSDTGEWVAETILSATVSNNTLIIR